MLSKVELNRSSFMIIYGLTTRKNLTFFEYWIFRIKMKKWNEFLQKQLVIYLIKPLACITNKTTKKGYKRYRWLNRMIKGLGVIICVNLFMQVPNAFAANYMFIPLKSIWQTITQKVNEEKKEKTSFFSKNFLIIGSLILSVSIGTILYHQDSISRVLFTPKFKELPVYARNFVSYTLEERNIIKSLNIEKNITTRNKIMEIIIQNFGLENVKFLSQGKLKIDQENSEKIFGFLVRVLNQYVRLNIFNNYLNDYEEYFHPNLINEFKNIKDTVGETLIRSVKNNPVTLKIFGSYMKEIMGEVVKKSHFDFTPEIQQEIINELVKIYLQQNKI